MRKLRATAGKGYLVLSTPPYLRHKRGLYCCSWEKVEESMEIAKGKLAGPLHHYRIDLQKITSEEQARDMIDHAKAALAATARLYWRQRLRISQHSLFGNYCKEGVNSNSVLGTQ